MPTQEKSVQKDGFILEVWYPPDPKGLFGKLVARFMERPANVSVYFTGGKPPDRASLEGIHRELDHIFGDEMDVYRFDDVSLWFCVVDDDRMFIRRHFNTVDDIISRHINKPAA